LFAAFVNAPQSVTDFRPHRAPSRLVCLYEPRPQPARSYCIDSFPSILGRLVITERRRSGCMENEWFQSSSGNAAGIAFWRPLYLFARPGWIKLGTYAVILPLIPATGKRLAQSRFARQADRAPFGNGAGRPLLPVTTISGTARWRTCFNNQGLAKTRISRGGSHWISVGRVDRQLGHAIPARPVP